MIMKIIPGLVLLVLYVALLGPDPFPQTKPPAIYVDKGACPFECCVYRKWLTAKSTPAYAKPDRGGRVIGSFGTGSVVRGLTGEVRTVPGKFVIRKKHKQYSPGDVLWVYTPLGEGFYKVWFKGKMYDEELDNMSGPFERAIPACDEVADCWGRLEKKLEVKWWVKVQSAEGWTGWSDEPENFYYKDGCG